jgi:hypothetical protein
MSLIDGRERICGTYTEVKSRETPQSANSDTCQRNSNKTKPSKEFKPSSVTVKPTCGSYASMDKVLALLSWKAKQVSAFHASYSCSALVLTHHASLGSFRAYLPPTWTFEYLEAPCDSQPGPGLKGIYPPPHFCFFDGYNPEEMEEAVEYVREVVEADGPFDGLMGFSQVSGPPHFLPTRFSAFVFSHFL